MKIIILMLQEVSYCEGACDGNNPTIARREDATIKYLYAVDHNDDGNVRNFLFSL